MMTPGAFLMQELCADRWATLLLVCIYKHKIYHSLTHIYYTCALILTVTMLPCCTDPVALPRARFGRGNDVPILLDDVRCTGTESRLIDCPYNANHNCDHSEDASVNCTTRMHITTCSFCTVCS